MSKSRKQIAAELQKGRSGAHKLAAMSVASPGMQVRTGYYTGTSRHTKAVDLLPDVCRLLDGYGILYLKGNDAPRGGVAGGWVQVLDPRSRVYKELAAQKKARADADAAREASILRGRVVQVAAHLLGTPVPILFYKGKRSGTGSLLLTGLSQGYTGVGTGTAYVLGRNVVAWHYGHHMPDGWLPPAGAEAVRVSLGGTQIFF